MSPFLRTHWFKLLMAPAALIMVLVSTPWGYQVYLKAFPPMGPETYQAEAGDVVYRHDLGEDYVLLLGRYDCLHCEAYHQGEFQEIAESAKATVIYRNIGRSLGEMRAGLALECLPHPQAGLMVDSLYAHEGNVADLDEAGVLALVPDEARTDVFDACMADTDRALKVEHGVIQTHRSYTILGTPTVIVNGKHYLGGITRDELASVLGH